MGYSEQIIGKINDMAPGIPNQDEVLDQLEGIEETPQYVMQPMNYGGIQWVSGQAQSNPHQMNSYEDRESFPPNKNAIRNVEFYPENGEGATDNDMIREDMQRMRMDYDLLNDRFLNLKD